MLAVVTPSVNVTDMACVGHVVYTITFPQLCGLTPTFAWLYIHMSVTRWDVTPRNACLWPQGSWAHRPPVRRGRRPPRPPPLLGQGAEQPEEGVAQAHPRHAGAARGGVAAALLPQDVFAVLESIDFSLQERDWALAS